jgi:hypothetical protein
VEVHEHCGVPVAAILDVLVIKEPVPVLCSQSQWTVAVREAMQAVAVRRDMQSVAEGGHQDEWVVT